MPSIFHIRVSRGNSALEEIGDYQPNSVNSINDMSIDVFAAVAADVDCLAAAMYISQSFTTIIDPLRLRKASRGLESTVEIFA